MSNQHTNRKKAFRIAVINAGTSVSEWARENAVSRTHLYAVLDGERQASDELNAKIDGLIEADKQVA